MRGATTASLPLVEILHDSAENIRLAPRDEVRLTFAPRKFTVFGAVGHASEFPIEDETMTLASALGQAGGLDPGSANASAVLVFRFERPDVASALSVHAPVSPKGVPIIYLVNMRDPKELFVANRFEIRPGDLIYTPAAPFIKLKQFIEIANAASGVAYNIRVTTAIVP